MSTKKSVKCKICGKKYVSKAALIEHLGKAHASSIPEGWSPARFENYLRTGKTEGHCVYCKKETTWNETTGKYNRMCGSEACKKKARELANKNYIGVHGKPYSINDPEQQKKMVYARKNSGTYIFEDEDTGKKYKAMYDSSYGKDFLEMIDTFLNWDGADIIAPSPHTYWYEYEGKKHFYIPDVYSTSLNLEIELKDGGDNPNKHPKIQAVDKVKEQKKDAVMESLKDQVNYIKICNKDYTEFFALLSKLKDKDVCQLPKWESRLESITESFDLIDNENGEDYVVEGTYNTESEVLEKVIYGKEIDRLSLDCNVNITGSSYDDMRSKNVASYDEKTMYDIIHSENIVEAYNAYMELDLDRIDKISDKLMDNQPVSTNDIQTALDINIVSDCFELINGGVFKTGEELKKYIVDQYFDKINDPTILRKTLQLRYNWNKRVTNLLERMLRNNYLSLGYTLEDANKMINKMKTGGSEKRKVVDKIVDDIVRNPNLYRGEIANTIDLTEFGAGKIYLSDDSALLIARKKYAEALLTPAVLYAFRYDVVIIGHGVSKESIDRAYSIPTDEFGDDDFSVNDIGCNDDNISIFYDVYGSVNFKSLVDSKTPINIKKSIDIINKTYAKYHISLKMDVLNELYGSLLKAKRSFRDGESNEDEFVFDCEMWMEMSFYNPRKPIVDADSALDEIDFIKNLLIECMKVVFYMNKQKHWISQRTRIDDNEPTVNTETIIRNAIKNNKNARTFMVLNCNPDHIKLSPDLVNDKKHLIHISNNNTLVDMYTSSELREKNIITESVEYVYESDIYEFDDILETTEKYIMEFAQENDINYDDDISLMEAMNFVDKNYSIITEGVASNIWRAVVEFIKKMIRALVGMFKAVINFFKKIFNAIKNAIKGLLGFDMTPDHFSYITLENASLNTIKPRNNKEIDTKLRKACDKMGRELQKLSQNQTKIMNEIKKDAEKQAQEHVNESTILEEVNQWKVNRAEAFSYYHLEEKKKNDVWDEELYYKTLNDAIKSELVNLANEERGSKEGQDTLYVYTMGKGYASILLGSITVRWFDYYNHDNPKYDYEWEETCGINKALIDPEVNPMTESSNLNPVSFMKRNHKLKHPMLNYDDLMEYYRKKIFHTRLKPLEQQSLYKELVNVRNYLQRVVNETGRPDNRMSYEAKKALQQVEGFIQYMEQKNEDGVMESSINKTNKIPIYIVSWNYGSLVGNAVRLTTGSKYNHTSIALTSDLEDCYTFSRNPQTTKSHSTNGFCRESLSYMVSRYGDCKIKVDAIYVSKSNYQKLQKIINEYKKHEEDTSFDYVNFARILFGIEKEDLDENKLNCSVFTDLVLKKSGIDVTNGKSSNLVTPSDLSNLDKTNKNVVTVYTGLASEYNMGAITEATSTLDKDFKKKTGKQFEYKPLTSNADKYFKDNPYWKKFGKYHKENSVGEIAIDKETGELAGYIFVKNKKSGEEGFITPLEVMKPYRGYGISNKLVDDAIHKYGAIDLTVDVDNEVAIDLYKKHGFVIIGYENEETKKRYWMKLRSKLTKDDTIMETTIDHYINPLSNMEDDIMESFVISQKDLYYNKDKFDSGEINICFAIGHMGSGKSTLGNKLEETYKIQHYDLDDVIFNDNFTDDNLKEYGNLIYSFFKTSGKKYRISKEDTKETLDKKFSDYEKELTNAFCKYGISYAKSHKNEKIFIEGIWIFLFTQPEMYKDCAFCIKGTSALKSYSRALKRNIRGHKYSGNKMDKAKAIVNDGVDTVNFEPKINKFRKYFESLGNIEKVSESTYIEGTKDNTKYYPVFIFLSYTGTNMAKLIKSFTHDPYAHSSISFDTELNHMVSFNREGMVEENIQTKIWDKNKDHIKYSLYMYMASADEYENMRNFVNELLGRRSKLRYNALGLTNFIFGRGSEREDKYFCSEFVASVISAGNTNIIKTRPYMTSPYMLAKNKNFKFIKKGILKNYNSKVVDNIVRDILEERGFEDVVIK